MPAVNTSPTVSAPRPVQPGFPPYQAPPAVSAEAGIGAADSVNRDLSYAARYLNRSIDDSSRNLERALSNAGQGLITLVRALDGTPIRDAGITGRLLEASRRATADSGVFYTSNMGGRDVNFNGNYVPQALTDAATARGMLMAFAQQPGPYPAPAA